MNGDSPRIEIFTPFGQAFELTKKILFQPFNFEKWLVIGFAAFLTGHFSGGGFSFPNNWRASTQNGTINTPDFSNWKPWLPIVIAICVMVFIVVLLVFTWLKARGTFIFTDCIVRNRGAIVEPWREYRREGNSLFLFQIALLFCTIAFFAAIAGVFAIMGVFSHRSGHHFGMAIIGMFIGVALCWMLLAFVFGIVGYFMPIVMYRRRCRAMDAFRVMFGLLMDHLGVFILLGLFCFVLLLAVVVVGAVATCFTCCLAALPYLGTVILLPMFVCLRSFGLCFLRQFGPEYDVWQASPQPQPLTIPASPPPVPPEQMPPPPVQT